MNCEISIYSTATYAALVRGKRLPMDCVLSMSEPDTWTEHPYSSNGL